MGDDGIFSCYVFGGVVSFMSTVNINGSDYMTTFYSFDMQSKEINYFSNNIRCKYSEEGFSADRYGRYYFIDEFDNSVLHCIKKSGTEFSVDFGDTVYQILCIDGEHVTAITSGGMYLISDGNADRFSTYTPSVPLRYTGHDTVTDRDGREYSYSGGVLTPTAVETSSLESFATSASDSQIEISEKHIYIPSGITVAKFRRSLNLSKDGLSIYKTSGESLSSGKLGTGMRADFGGKTYTIILKGDLTGEGNINSRDLRQIMKYVTNEESPNSVQALAADMNTDSKINTKDILALANMY